MYSEIVVTVVIVYNIRGIRGQVISKIEFYTV